MITTLIQPIFNLRKTFKALLEMIVLKEAKGIWCSFVSANIETFSVKDLQRRLSDCERGF